MKLRLKVILFIVVVCVVLVLITGYVRGKAESNDIKEVVEVQENIEEVQTEVYIDVWTTSNNTYIKSKPVSNSESIGVYYWNTKLLVTYVNDDWAKIKDVEHYIHRESITETPVTYVNRDVPKNNTIKSYMGYKAITSKTSNQYKLQHSFAYTDANGLRVVNGRYCVALGSYYTTTIGQYVDIELENGSVIRGILADCKSDKHTDSTNRINPNGSVVEFVVDSKALNKTAKKMGDISHVNGWNSKVVNIKVYDVVEDF